jgi:hypothetical protein
VLSAEGFDIASPESVGFCSGSNPIPAVPAPSLLYDTANGSLSWDADGTGAAAPVLLATLSLSPKLTLADFGLAA